MASRIALLLLLASASTAYAGRVEQNQVCRLRSGKACRPLTRKDAQARQNRLELRYSAPLAAPKTDRNDPPAVDNGARVPTAPPGIAPSLPGSVPGSPVLAPIRSSIEVQAVVPGAMEALAPAAHITQRQILSAAGTFGDFTRYLQTLPGVVWSSDMSNEILVRGGHPMENLFVVDGIEIANINHFALSSSNGGFTSMIDAATIGSVDLRAGVYDASFSSRLSSLIQVHTRGLGEARRAGEFTFGISGAGGFYQTNLNPRTSLLVSAHRSIIGLVTSDVGLNGSPTYSNGLTRLEWNPGPRDSLSALTLSGRDSIRMTPCPGDYEVTSTVQTQYVGWRSTEGMEWSHLFSPRLNSRFTASTSTAAENIGQQFQIGNIPVDGISSCKPESLEPVYLQRSQDGISQMNYQVQGDVHGWLLTAGAGGKLVRPSDTIEQPVGEPSPFNVNPAWSDAVTVDRHFNTGQSAAFVEAEGNLGSRWKALAALRVETFALTGSHALDPRLSLAYRFNPHQFLHASAGMSSQLPPVADLLTYQQNRLLQPIQVRQASAGMRLFETGWGTLDAEVYDKRYRHEAVSTEYPQLMLSNMVDTLGQWFVWLPLTSGGTASARGLEVSLRAHRHNRMQLLTTGTWSRSTYRALDGVRRRGNYDFPLVTNTMGSLVLFGGLDLNFRETWSSGRPYTPFNVPESLAQNRGIYDLTQVNGQRGPFYNRLDLELEKSFRIKRGRLDLHGGADNVLDRGNLLGYVWMQNCQNSPDCTVNGAPVGRLPQMGLFPALSIRYQF